MEKILNYRPPRIAFLCLISGWVAHHFSPVKTILYLPFPLLGVLSLTAGILIMVWAWALFRKVNTAICPTSRAKMLVESGQYRFSRNPMYPGMLLMLTGAALIVWPGVEKMTFISGGQSYQESAEILGSPRMKELLSDLKGRYPERYVIFDAPSVLAGADAQTLAPLLDLVIVVVRAGKTSMDDVRKAIQFLPKEKILGLVLNRC